MKLNLDLNPFSLEMSELCSCVAQSQIYLPIPLLKIIQAYAHSEISEEFYCKNYSSLRFRVRLNKDPEELEEVATIDLVSSYNPKLLTVNAFSVYIFEMRDPRNVPSQWLRIDFVVNNKRHSFITCLTSFIQQEPDGWIPFASHEYSFFQRKLLEYFGKGNRDILLAEILKKCNTTPIREDYDQAWAFINKEILTHVSTIDFWSEIHR